jgi:hypothetical protein
MATGAGGFTFDENDETNSLYHGGVTAYNPNIENASGAYWEPEAERKWKERAAEINAQRRLEKKIEKKVYKRLIKELLKKI